MSKKRNQKIVCFGGGSVLPRAVLMGLKKYPVSIVSITSMLESGGSTGQLRKDFNVLPSGDISRHLIALSDGASWKKNLFYFRFGKEKFPGGHVGHRFGTVFIAGLEYLLRDFEKALEIAHDFFEIKKHRVLPATLNKTHLWALLGNNRVIRGEDEIDVPKIHDGNLKIKKLFLKPRAKAYPPVLREIKKADLIIIGPGDLYSSLIACLLPNGMKDAFRKARAKKVFVCPLMTKHGETNHFSVLDFTHEIEKYLGVPLDYVIYNSFIPTKIRIKKHQKKYPELLGPVKINDALPPKKFIGKNLLVKRGPIEHDSSTLAKILISLI